MFLSYEELVNPEEPWEIIFKFTDKDIISFNADGAAQMSVWELLTAI